jgi:predicted RNase H-like HicB family nuclease
MKTLADYTVVVMPDDGTWVAYVPALEGCHAVADSPEEARAELDNVFQMFREIYEEEGRQLPPNVRELVAIAG